jgi:hypothetical protein
MAMKNLWAFGMGAVAFSACDGGEPVRDFCQTVRPMQTAEVLRERAENADLHVTKNHHGELMVWRSGGLGSSTWICAITLQDDRAQKVALIED